MIADCPVCGGEHRGRGSRYCNAVLAAESTDRRMTSVPVKCGNPECCRIAPHNAPGECWT